MGMEERRRQRAERRMTERQEARMDNIEAERRAARTSQISTRRFEAPTPSSNIHSSSQCGLNIRKSLNLIKKVKENGHQNMYPIFSKDDPITTGFNDIKCPLCQNPSS